jgi:O-antigen/teichoic acid export membrane protein
VYCVRFSVASTADRILPGQLAARARPILGRLDALMFAADERGAAGRTSLVAFAIRTIAAVFVFVSQVLMARWMGSFEYGIFVLVWTTVVIVGTLTCLGFGTSVIRFIPQYRERGQLAELRGVMSASRSFVLVVSTLFTVVGVLGVWLFSDSIDSYYVIPFYLGLVCMPMIALSDVLEGVARANSWAVLALTPIYLLRPILTLAAMGGALFAGFEADAQTAMIAAILATWATALYQLAAIAPSAGREVSGVKPNYRMREWILVSAPIFLVEGFFFMLTNADVLMVGWFMQPTDVAIYFAAVKTLALVHFVYFAVKAGAAQRYAQYAHGENPAKLAEFARETVVWTFWPSLAMGVVVLAVGKPMLMLFGEGFDAGYPLLFVLVLGIVARSAVGPAESMLTMTGHQNVCAAVYGITLAVNIALNFALIPYFGLWGAAIATCVAMLCEALLLYVTVRRKLGIAMFVAAGAG